VISTRVVNSPLKTRRERGLVYLLTSQIWWFIFLPFILFDFRKTSQGKKISKDTECASLCFDKNFKKE
jgi:hypothetical protein